jgi:hypothetical protein
MVFFRVSNRICRQLEILCRQLEKITRTAFFLAKAKSVPPPYTFGTGLENPRKSVRLKAPSPKACLKEIAS